MLFLSDFLNAIKLIKKDKGEYFFLFFQLVVLAGMWNFVLTDNFLYFNFTLCLLINFKNKIKYSLLFKIFITYVSIFLIHILFFGLNEFNAYVGFALRLFTGVLIANYFRERFIEKFEVLVFVLAFISIPLFIIQVINPHIYDVFTVLSRAIIEGRQDYDPRDVFNITMHQYFFIYVLNGWCITRNSGFMWEPAAFGAMLAYAAIFNLFLNNFKINNRLIILFIAAITTFSLGTFSYFSILVLVFLIKNNLNIKYYLFILISLLILFIIFTKSDFFVEQYTMMNEKSEKYQNVDDAIEKIDVNNTKTNRVVGFLVNVKNIFMFPFGIGMNALQYNTVASPNGFSRIIVMWGFIGFLLLLYSFFKLILLLQKKTSVEISKTISLLLLLTITLTFFGNPFYNQSLIFSILFIGYYY